MKKCLVIISVGLVSFFLCSAALAQAPQEPSLQTQTVEPQAPAPEAPAPEETEYTFGTVVKVDVTTNEITITEYDWETDSEVTNVYSVDFSTAFENIASLAEIAVGDDVDIEYISGADGKKIAKVISKYATELPAPEDIPGTE